MSAENKKAELQDRINEVKTQAMAQEQATFAAQILPTEIPSNVQIHEKLDIAKEELELKKYQAGLNDTGKKIVTDAQALIDSTQRFIDEKNSGEQIQRLIHSTQAAAGAAADSRELAKLQGAAAAEGAHFAAHNTPNISGVSNLIGLVVPGVGNIQGATGSGLKSGIRGLQDARRFIADVMQSNDLRSMLISLIVTLRDTLDSASANLDDYKYELEKYDSDAQLIGKLAEKGYNKLGEGAQKLNEAAEAGLNKAEKAADDIEKGKPGYWTEEKVKELRGKFTGALRTLSESPVYARVANSLLDMIDEAREVAMRLGDKSADSAAKISHKAEVQDMLYDLRALMEAFTSHDNLELLIDDMKNIVELVQLDPELNNYYKDMSKFLRKILKEPHKLTSEEDKEAEAMFDKTREMAKSAKSNVFLRRLIRDAENVIEDITNDPTTKRLLEDGRRLAEDLFIDKNGRPVLKPEALAQLKILLTSLALEQLKDFPLPPVKGENDKFQYALSDLKFTAWEILPRNITITSVTKFEMDTENVTSDASTRFTIRMTDLCAHMNEVKFFFKRKGLIDLEDAGIANVAISKPGATVYIDLESRTDLPENQLFKIKKVYVNLGNLKLHVVNSKYDWLINILSPIIARAIKSQIQKEIENKLTSVIHIIDGALNEFVRNNQANKAIHDASDIVKEELTEIKRQKEAIEKNRIVVHPQ